MFTPDSSRIYSIVPVKDTAEDCVKIQELCLPYDKCCFNRAGHAFFSKDVLTAMSNLFPFTEKETRNLSFIQKVKSRETVSASLYFFCIDNEVVGYGCILRQYQVFGIVIRHDMQGTGIASFFAERFMIRFQDKIAEIGKPWGALVGLAEKRKQAMQNNIQQATAL